LTLHMQVRNYMKIAHPETQVSKVAYHKQRMKLNPEAIKFLYQNHNKNYYQDPEETPRLFSGYLVLAADGSGINIPTTEETLELFGAAGRKDAKLQAQLGLGCLYDVLNKFILDSDINRVKFHEMGIAEKQIGHVRETIGDKYPFMVLMDRGYPSIPAIMRMLRDNITFVIRLASTDFKSEQRAMKSDDEDVEIRLTASRRNNYRGTADEELVMQQDSFHLRMVRVTLDTGESEVLITNLPREEFPQEKFKEIYHLRWGIETAYETLKDRLQLENFSGVKARILEQDIYSTIYVNNLAEDIIHDVEKENEERLKSGYKHKMMLNRNVCIGILKDELIHAIIEADQDKQAAMMQSIYDELSRNVVPIRPDRHYERNKSNLHAKYSNTHKRSF
ncbi:IS4 family transposase, partial [Paenibacillus sp.]